MLRHNFALGSLVCSTMLHKDPNKKSHFATFVTDGVGAFYLTPQLLERTCDVTCRTDGVLWGNLRWLHYWLLYWDSSEVAHSVLRRIKHHDMRLLGAGPPPTVGPPPAVGPILDLRRVSQRGCSCRHAGAQLPQPQLAVADPQPPLLRRCAPGRRRSARAASSPLGPPCAPLHRGGSLKPQPGTRGRPGCKF